MTPNNPASPPLTLLSVVIPARNEEEALPATVEHLHLELCLNGIPHEIIVVDDGSTDQTWPVLQALQQRVPVLPGDSADSLAARVFAAECEAYPQAIGRHWQTIGVNAAR